MQFLAAARDETDHRAAPDAGRRGDPCVTGEAWRTIGVAPVRRAP